MDNTRSKVASTTDLWMAAGLIATVTMTLALPLYLFKEFSRTVSTKPSIEATFAGSKSCAECHEKEYNDWQESHHAKAMAVATDETVLGDFNNAIFEKNGVVSRFYKKDDKFFVHTAGEGGKMDDFEITHTFGWYPLQQYLIPFPGGRMQCLPLAWDLKEKKWFHLYPDLTLDPEEWIYWTNQAQNWNSMCADCHSTQLKKNYDPETCTYDTKWAEINVGCEACHGPGSLHNEWGRLPEMARTRVSDGLLVKTSTTNNSIIPGLNQAHEGSHLSLPVPGNRQDSGLSIEEASDAFNRQQVEICAPCHSRASILGDYDHQQQDLLDTEAPRLYEERLYHPDGQILDEVYVYGSYVQSKMYANNVRCANCHNVHSIKLQEEGNKLCLQCHQESVYDSPEHHFHKAKGEDGDPILDHDGKILFDVGTGTECIQCHMPGQYYMVNDYRPDHSIRVPRPDLSVTLGTPNACNRCHVDKTNEWSAEYTEKWYGSKRKYHYGTTFAAAREGKPGIEKELIDLVDDDLASHLVRATALSFLGQYEGEDVITTFTKAIESDEAILRRTAITYLPLLSREKLLKLTGPLLDDAVKGVRIEAARALTAIPPGELPKRWRDTFNRSLEEYKEVALYSADFAPSRENLGVIYTYQGNEEEAIKHFLKAIAINRDFYTARMNLAVLYSRQGKSQLAEVQLRKALEFNPELFDVHYSLGLLLSEQKKYREAVLHLRIAANGMPHHGRAFYNLGQLLDFLKEPKAAEAALIKAIEIEPENLSYLKNIARFYMTGQNLSKAEIYGEKIMQLAPEDKQALQLLQYLKTIRNR